MLRASLLFLYLLLFGCAGRTGSIGRTAEEEREEEQTTGETVRSNEKAFLFHTLALLHIMWMIWFLPPLFLSLLVLSRSVSSSASCLEIFSSNSSTQWYISRRNWILRVDDDASLVFAGLERTCNDERKEGWNQWKRSEAEDIVTLKWKWDVAFDAATEENLIAFLWFVRCLLFSTLLWLCVFVSCLAESLAQSACCIDCSIYWDFSGWFITLIFGIVWTEF